MPLRRALSCWPISRAVSRAVSRVCLLCLVLAASAAAGELTREQALMALDSPDAAARREAVAELGRTGGMADAGALIEHLRDEDADVRALAERAVWQVWARSGDPEVDGLLQRGIRQMEDGQMGQAVAAFTRVIDLRPDFAEGWNKRATAYYLIGDYEQSLKDCDQVIERNPSHFGALSGYGLIYVQLGELERALEYFERALEINPNMEGVEQSIALIRYRLGQSGKQSI
jgi:tetratricopeptide (TPR) repeat protein